MKSVLSQDDTRRPMESTVPEGRQRRFKDRVLLHTADVSSSSSPAALVAELTGSAGTATQPMSVRGRLAALFEKARARTQDPYRYLLVLRFMLLNLVACGLLGAAYAQGLVDMVIAADRTYLSVVIFIVFLGGLGLCMRRVWQSSQDLNIVREVDTLAQWGVARGLASLLGKDTETQANLDALRLRLSYRISIVRHIANSLVLLGLVGTVLGFIIALSGVDPSRASDISAIAPMVSTLISGMSTALYTTLVGAVLNMWLMANHQLLAGGTVKVLAALTELAEKHARD